MSIPGKYNDKWEVWKHKEYSMDYLSRWGPPDDIKEWEPGKIFRLTRAAHYQVGESALDVGCGLGHLYTLLKDKVRYVGVDISEHQLEIAEVCFPLASFRLQTLRDMSGIPSCDTVYALSVLLHLPDFPLEKLWEKAEKCLVFNLFLAPEEHIEQSKEGYIVHYQELESLLNKCRALPGVDYFTYKISGPWQEKGDNFILMQVLREEA